MEEADAARVMATKMELDSCYSCFDSGRLELTDISTVDYKGT